MELDHLGSLPLALEPGSHYAPLRRGDFQSFQASKLKFLQVQNMGFSLSPTAVKTTKSNEG